MHNFLGGIISGRWCSIFSIFMIWYFKVTKSLYLISRSCNQEYQCYLASASSLSLIGFVPAAVSASSAIYLLPMWILFGFGTAVVNVYRGGRYDEG